MPEAGRGRSGGLVEGSITAGAGGKEAGAREAVPGPPGYQAAATEGTGLTL